MFTRTFHYTMDAKRRIFIPAEWRDELGVRFIITPDLHEHCLRISSQPNWEEYITPILKQDRTLAARAMRFLLPNSVDPTPDAQGRVILNDELVKHAGLTKNIVAIGCYDHGEIWSEEAYAKMMQGDGETDLAEELAKLGL